MRCGVLALGWGYSTAVEHSSCLPSLGQALGSILCNEETKQNKRTGDLVSAVRGMSELTVEGKRKDTPPTGRIAGARQGQHGIEEQEMKKQRLGPAVSLCLLEKSKRTGEGLHRGWLVLEDIT